MTMKIEHIGIAVKDLTASNELFSRLLGEPPYKTEAVATEKVVTSFFRAGESKIELLESTAPDGPIARFIGKRGEGIHHIAFEVADIIETMRVMKERGFELLSETPKMGADNKLVVFVHPRSANGILVEFCQEIR
jgi:methylmalonyl-CoA/ethylmalonyl-CoA epimerase